MVHLVEPGSRGEASIYHYNTGKICCISNPEDELLHIDTNGNLVKQIFDSPQRYIKDIINPGNN